MSGSASFVAMNEVYGGLFEVSKADAATPAMAQERANALKDQFIMDMHTHFLRGDTRIITFVNMRTRSARPAGINSWRNGSRRSRTSKFNNYKKEIFFDSDTKIFRHLLVGQEPVLLDVGGRNGIAGLVAAGSSRHRGRKSRQFLQRKHLPRSWH